MFTLGLFVLGGVCMHELYAMYDARPTRAPGGLARARGPAARRRSTAASSRCCSPPSRRCRCCSALTLLQPRPSVGGLAVTLLGIYWIGFALAHAVLLRGLPHGEGIVIDVLVGHVPRRHRRLPRRAACSDAARWRPSISPNKTVEGLVIGMVFAVLGVWIAGRYQEWLPGTPRARARRRRRARRARRRPVRVVHQARGRQRRTPAACSARTAARSTAWTRCCSRRSSATTSGRRTYSLAL